MRSLVLVIMCMTAAVARADLVLSFHPASNNILVGETVSVDIVLTQFEPIDPEAVDITTNGVSVADIQLSLDTAAAIVTSLDFGTGFTDSLFSNLTDPLSPLLSADGGISGVRAPVGSPTAITIGTFNFTGQFPGTTTVTMVNSLLTDFVFATDPTPNSDIDSKIFGSESLLITVSAVPEPSSFVFLGGVGLALWLPKRCFGKLTRGQKSR